MPNLTEPKLISGNANRTLAIDTAAPIVVQTADIFSGFNTSSATPTITINITDVNGTGVDLSSSANNLTLNVSIYNAPSSSSLRSYNLSSSSLTCSSGGVGAQSTQCTLNLDTLSLTNGTKNITIAVSDRAGFVNNTEFSFTVDSIAPTQNYFNISSNTTGYFVDGTPGLGSSTAGTVPTSGDGTWAQGRQFLALANFLLT